LRAERWTGADRFARDPNAVGSATHRGRLGHASGPKPSAAPPPGEFSHHVRHGPSCSRHRDTASPTPAVPRRRGPTGTISLIDSPRPAQGGGPLSTPRTHPVSIRALRDSRRGDDDSLGFDSIRAPPAARCRCRPAALDDGWSTLLPDRQCPTLPACRRRFPPLILVLRAAAPFVVLRRGPKAGRQAKAARRVPGRGRRRSAQNTAGPAFSNGAGGAERAAGLLWSDDITAPRTVRLGQGRGLRHGRSVCASGAGSCRVTAGSTGRFRPH
jgi:hypothetical protein